MKTCPSCGSPLMRIDYYGEVLVGCVECNRWGRSGDKKLPRASERRRHPRHFLVGKMRKPRRG